MWKGEWEQTTGVWAAAYGVGFFLYGLIGMATGELLGLDSIHALHEHRLIFSLGCMAVGALLIWFGWKRPE
jgi:hypothetical protein